MKNPDGSLNRAAMTQSQLAKERRELRQAQVSSLIDQIPKVRAGWGCVGCCCGCGFSCAIHSSLPKPQDFNKSWVDPVPEAGERHFAQELRSINIGDNLAMPEWKEQVRMSVSGFVWGWMIGLVVFGLAGGEVVVFALCWVAVCVYVARVCDGSRRSHHHHFT